MHTVLTTNNAYDSLLLVDDNDRVVSRWDVTRKQIKDFIEIGANADDWLIDVWPQGFHPDLQDTAEEAAALRTIEAYGTEYGRDGKINSQERREFWRLDNKVSRLIMRYVVDSNAGDDINGNPYRSWSDANDACISVYGEDWQDGDDVDIRPVEFEVNSYTYRDFEEFDGLDFEDLEFED